MVEFGLKLQDNKVQEWSNKYIDYEKLKQLLKIAKKARKARDSLENEHPDITSDINKKGDSESFMQYDTAIVDEPSESDLDFLSVETMAQESVPLMIKDKSGQKLQDCEDYESAGSLKRSGSDGSGSFNLFVRMNSVGTYFQRSYSLRLEELSKAEDLAIEKFSTCIFEEFRKVNIFYNGEIDDITERLKLLKEDAPQSKPARSTALNKLKKYIDRRKSSGEHDRPSDNIEYDEDSDDEMKGITEVNKRAIEEKIRESESIQRSLVDLHRRVKLLSNFSIMNVTGFIKIIKKFQKTFSSRKEDFRSILEDKTGYGNGSATTEKAVEMEKLFSDWFCQGNVIEARAKMLTKKGDGLEMDWSQLRLGYRLGMCSILALWVCWDCIWGLVASGHSTIGRRTAFPVFRACGGLLLVHWFWGMSVYVWNRYRVNYIYLFEFDPRKIDSPITIFENVTDETLVYLILMLLYYKAGSNDFPNIFPPGCYPFLLVLFTLKCMFTPIRTRGPLWKGIGAVFCAPFVSPTFFHTYIADVFTSMVKVFQDILWTGCFILSGDFLTVESTSGNVETSYHDWQKTRWYKNVIIPLICLFPLWIRFNQCLRRYMDTGKRMPHLANAFKYAISQTVTLFGAFHPIYLLYHSDDLVDMGPEHIQVRRVENNIFQIFWMGLFVTSSLYSYFWDVYFDWGLGRPEYRGLGARLMFPNLIYYYAVLVVDLFLRFMWVLTLIPPQSGARFELPNYLTAFTMALELFRRTIWGFFRLEHEHRSNTEGFRRVEFVPLHFSTGHNHKYEKKNTHVGWSVLGEVTVVAVIVISVSVGSVVAAQKASRGLALENDIVH